MTQSHRWRGYALVLVAATLWGTLGIIFKVLSNDYGLSRITVAFFRAALSGLILFPVLAVRSPRSLRISPRHLVFFVAFGLAGIAAFYLVYTTAIDLAGVSVASVLLYTAPAWVAVISAVFLGERLTRRTILAVALAMAGCALIARVYDVQGLRLNVWGILAGLGAGLGYALYSVLNKVGVRRYSEWTVLAYALLFGTLFMAPLQSPALLLGALRQPGAVAWLLALALGPTLGSGWTFNAGLKYVPVSSASVTATIEPVVASVLAFGLLGERLEPIQLVGGGLILAAVLVLTTVRQE